MDGEIQPAAVKAMIASGLPADAAIVDIRSRREFASGHIPGSLSMPFGTLETSIDQLDGYRRVVTVCPHGAASVGAARLIAAYDGLADDATVESMAGGLAAWDGDLVAGRPADNQADGEPEAPF